MISGTHVVVYSKDFEADRAFLHDTSGSNQWMGAMVG
jgi:hypothetical protein